MIESVFGILQSAVEYSVKVNQFEYALKYILKNKFDLNPECLSVRINTINNETVLKFDKAYEDEVSLRLTNKPYSYSNEKNIKKRLLLELFNSNDVSEEVIYNNLAQYRPVLIKFKIASDNTISQEKRSSGRNIQIERINAQIKILNEKKFEIINNLKR